KWMGWRFRIARRAFFGAVPPGVCCCPRPWTLHTLGLSTPLFMTLFGNWFSVSPTPRRRVAYCAAWRLPGLCATLAHAPTTLVTWGYWRAGRTRYGPRTGAARSATDAASARPETGRGSRRPRQTQWRTSLHQNRGGPP